MLNETIRKVLETRSYSHIKDISSQGTYAGKSYQYMFQFVMSYHKELFIVVLCIPFNWEEGLFDVYLNNYMNFGIIPHLEKNGKLCLFDLEGVLIRYDFEGLLNAFLDRTELVLKKGTDKSNAEDFIKEFQSYWSYLPNVISGSSMVSITKEIKNIYYTEEVKASAVPKMVSVSRVYVSENAEQLNNHKKTPVIKGIYIYIKLDEYLYPPDWRNELPLQYINDILGHSVYSEKKLSIFFSGKMKTQILFICVEQPDGNLAFLPLRIKNAKFEISGGKPQISNLSKMSPCNLQRADEEYVKGRVGVPCSAYAEKILIIGCGSIGGYLYSELLKSGYNNFCLVDNDILCEDNIYRHLLGLKYVGRYKTKALKDWTAENYPYTKAISIEEKFEDAVEEGTIDLKEFDLIFSAVGNHNFNRRLNKYLLDKCVESQIVYLWNEVFGIGNHVAFINTKYKGCYNCFFKEGEAGLVDRTSFCEADQIFTKRMHACGTTFMPYSSNTSLLTVNICLIELAKYYRENRAENILVSFKGDSGYLKQEGFEVSYRYMNQKEIIAEITGDIFHNDKCKECVVR